MQKVKIYCSWDLYFDLELSEQVELIVDFHNINNTNPNRKKVLFVLEPHDIMPQFTNMAIQQQNKFDYILTHNENILKSCPNARLFEFASTWIKDYRFPEKEFSVSTIVGGKLMAPGHHLRQKLWYKENKITNIPTKFFISGNYSGALQNYNNNPVLGKDKNVLFDSQFHIVIENAKRKYWFTEKLIDCLQTKTIPIYWGATAIDEYFNLNGMFVVDNFEDIIDICNNLNSSTYLEKLEFVEENYEISKKFADLSDRLKNKLTELYKNE
jgi:hypothetical protein